MLRIEIDYRRGSGGGKSCVEGSSEKFVGTPFGAGVIGTGAIARAGITFGVIAGALPTGGIITAGSRSGSVVAIVAGCSTGFGMAIIGAGVG